MLKEYHRNLIYYIKDAHLGISGLEIAFQGVKQPSFAYNSKEREMFDISRRFE